MHMQHFRLTLEEKSMSTKTIFVAAVVAGLVGVVPLPAAADIYVNLAPPAPRHEVVPGPRAGYVWVPGHWQWSANNHRYYWTAGYWERNRPGYVFRGPEWVQRDGRWHYQARRWDYDHYGYRPRDRDGDGIPDHRDDRPHDPTRG
jgi:hypothetical protein